MSLITISENTLSLILFFSSFFTFLFQNVFWIIAVGLLITLVGIIRPSVFNRILRKKTTREELIVPLLLLVLILVILPFLWWIILKGDYFLTYLGISAVIFGKIVNIVHIFIPFFITSFAIYTVTLFYLTRYFILQRKTSLINLDETRKRFYTNEPIRKGILAGIALLFFFFFFGIFPGQIYLEYIPKKPVEKVIIETYGDIPDYITDVVAEVIENKTGLQVSIENSYAAITPENQLYNSTREQFYADRLWELDEDFAGNLLSGNSQRIIKIVDVDLYTEGQPQRPYVFSRSMPNVKTILISTYRLQKLSDTKDEPAPKELVKSRIRKIVLQTLSRSASLYPFSLRDSFVSTEIDCVTIAKNNLSDLDKGKEIFSEEIKRKNWQYYFDI